jgi:tRNA(Arg) A34 adenosine deaminase TadA
MARDPAAVGARDHHWLRESFAVARAALDSGNAPFGAVLVDASGNELLRAENTAVVTRDVTGHAEINAVREATPRFDRAVLIASTMYASSEPCAMCAASIFWAGIGRVVFGMSSARLRAFLELPEGAPWLRLSCVEVAARGHNQFAVIGPVLEDEAELVHIEARNRHTV